MPPINILKNKAAHIGSKFPRDVHLYLHCIKVVVVVVCDEGVQYRTTVFSKYPCSVSRIESPFVD